MGGGGGPSAAPAAAGTAATASRLRLRHQLSQFSGTFAQQRRGLPRELCPDAVAVIEQAVHAVQQRRLRGSELAQGRQGAVFASPGVPERESQQGDELQELGVRERRERVVAGASGGSGGGSASMFERERERERRRRRALACGGPQF